MNAKSNILICPYCQADLIDGIGPCSFCEAQEYFFEQQPSYMESQCSENVEPGQTIKELQSDIAALKQQLQLRNIF